VEVGVPDDDSNAPTGQFECNELSVVANGATVYHWLAESAQDHIPFQAEPVLQRKGPTSLPGGPISIIITDDPGP
jgi:hypothetical protein